MKKSVVLTLVLTLVLALILSISSTVFAVQDDRELGVTVTVDPTTEVKAGDRVTATVTFINTPVATGRFTLNYDEKSLELDKNVKGLTLEVDKAGAMGYRWLDVETTTLTFTFTVKEAAEAGKTAITFTPGELVAKDEAELIATPVSAEVTVAKAPVPEPTPDEQQTPSTPAGDNGNSNGSNVAGNDNQGQTGRPTRMPQAGVNCVAVGGIIVALVAGIAVVVRKRM